jgi:competence protein ComEC
VYAQLPRYPEVAPGDRISFSASLDAPPDGPGFADYLARNGAVATCRIRAFSPEAPASGAIGSLERSRRDAADLLARVLPAHEAGLAAGMLIGLRDRVDRQVAADFTTSGLSHVVAISGWNIALVGAVILACLRRLARRPRSVLLVVAIALYTVAAGASPSVVRAALMGGIVLVARESGRKGAAPAALGLATTGLLVAEPAMIDDAGFRLSVAATAGLLAWATPLDALLRRRAPRRAPGWLLESLGVSLAAQAATLPLVLLDFGRLSLIAPVANLVVAPLVAPAMLAGTVALLAGGALAVGAPSVLGMAAATGGWAALGSIIAIARTAASIPLASLELPPPWNLAGSGIAAVALVAAGTSRGRRAARAAFAPIVRTGATAAPNRDGPPAGGHIGGASLIRAGASRSLAAGHARRTSATGRRALVVAGSAAAIVMLSAVVAAARPDGRLRVTVLDVGQGDALLLQGPRGGRMLLDSGPDPDRLVAALDSQLPPWDRRLDVVVLTHPHEDHVAGAALLLERYAVAAIAENGMLGNGPGDAAYRRELARRGVRSAVLARGDRLDVDGIRLDVLWPPRGTLPERAPSSGRTINDSSLVLDVRFGQRRFLLTGDVEDDVDPKLLAAGIADGGRVDFLKVAHHGSGTATTDAFVTALQPRVAAVSVGARNDYGHPSPKTLARLEASGAAVLRTDIDGTITISTDGTDLHVQAASTRLAFVPARTALHQPPASRARIGGWPSRAAPRASRCCAPSIRRGGSFATASRSPRSRRSSPNASSPPASRSIAAASRQRRSSTTSTSCSLATTRCSRSGTAPPVRAGSRSTDIGSWPDRSPPIRSRVSPTTAGTGAGRRSRTGRRASWRTRTSAPASGSGRSPPGSMTWHAATRNTPRRCAPPGRARCSSSARCATRRASRRTRSDGCHGSGRRATRSRRHADAALPRRRTGRVLVGRGRVRDGPGRPQARPRPG